MLQRNKLFKDYHAVLQAINSCTSAEQLESAEHLIVNFGNTHIQITAVVLFMNDLRCVLEEKQKSINSSENLTGNDNNGSNERSSGTGADQKEI